MAAFKPTAVNIQRWQHLARTEEKKIRAKAINKEHFKDIAGEQEV